MAQPRGQNISQEVSAADSYRSHKQIAYPSSRVIDKHLQRGSVWFTTESTDNKLTPAEISHSEWKEGGGADTSKLHAC